MTYDKNNLAESGVQSVIDRIVHNSLAMRAYAIKLFQASITAAHTGSENK